MDLATDIQKIEEGWNAGQYISGRADRIRSHVKAGAMKRAEELAFEIDCLQEADRKQSGFGEKYNPTDKDEWQLTAGAWAELLIHAYRMNRKFFVPVGGSVDEALREARRVKFDDCLTVCDIEPVYPVRMSVAAE